MSFTCPTCGMTSHNPNDEKHGWCGNCHGFTGDKGEPLWTHRGMDTISLRDDYPDYVCGTRGTDSLDGLRRIPTYYDDPPDNYDYGSYGGFTMGAGEALALFFALLALVFLGGAIGSALGWWA